MMAISKRPYDKGFSRSRRRPAMSCPGFEEKELHVQNQLKRLLDDNKGGAVGIAGSPIPEGTASPRGWKSLKNPASIRDIAAGAAGQTAQFVVESLSLANKQEDKGRCEAAIKTLDLALYALPTRK